MHSFCQPACIIRICEHIYMYILILIFAHTHIMPTEQAEACCIFDALIFIMVNNRDRESHIIYTWPQSAKPYRESHLCDWLSTHFVRIRYAICTHSFHACLSNNVTIFGILYAGFVVCFVRLLFGWLYVAFRFHILSCCTIDEEKMTFPASRVNSWNQFLEQF